MSRLNGQVKEDWLQGTEVTSLLSKSEITNPNGQVLRRSGGEAAAATILSKRVRAARWAGLAEGQPAVGLGTKWGKGASYLTPMILLIKLEKNPFEKRNR
jgi:hypothetical protein